MRKLIFFISFLFSNYLFGQIESNTDVQQEEVNGIIDFVISHERLVENIDPSTLTSLPIGIVREIGATRYIIAIDSAIFKPTGAYFNAYFAVEFPGTNKRICFAAKNIKFNPQGVIGGEQSKLFLVSEHQFKISPKIDLHLIPDGRNYVEWNCEGYSNINLSGSFEFSEDWFKPINNSPAPVKANFEIHTEDIHNIITSVSFTPFTLKGLNDWEFSVTNAVVDMSELSNYPSQVFPTDYQFPFVNSPSFWTGFYLKNILIKLPKEFSKHNQPTQIVGQNLLIDQTGFTGIVDVQNIFNIDEASMSGWGFSLDNFGVSFISNRLVGGNMGGKIKIPATDNGINYTANISYHPILQRSDYQFILSPIENISFDALSAKVDIHQTSIIDIRLQNGQFKPKAILNGDISFLHENASTKKLQFQHLTFETEAPYLTNGIFSLTGSENDSENKLARFNISISNIGLITSNTYPKIGMKVGLNFLDAGSNSLSAETNIAFGAKVNETNGNQSWSFDKVSVNQIKLRVQTSPFYVNGLINFIDNDPLFGDGFAGQLYFRLPGIIEDSISMNAQFGNTSFRYFYFDGYFPFNIDLGNIKITRLGGGLYYHMRPINNAPSQFFGNLQTPPNTNAHRTKYLPDETIGIGFKAGVNFQSKASEKAFNGDALMEIAFQSAGGLDFIRLIGNAYMMATVAERNSKPAPVRGQVEITYDHINKIFDASLSAIVKATGVNGNALTKIHIEREDWFIAVGRPSQPAQLSLVGLPTTSSYILVGTELEPMAPVPSQVASLVGSNGLDHQRDETALANASGFAAGIRFYGSYNSDEDNEGKFRVYTQFAYGIGFDMMLANYGPNAHCTNSTTQVGLNGWVASGQLFAYLQGQLGVRGTILKKDFDILIISGTVTAILGGKLPNPAYAYGAIVVQYSILGVLNGSFDFNFKVGSECTIVN